jgi:predicted small secreted protein
MRNTILAGLFVFGVAAPSLAHAEDLATTDDVRCLVVSLAIAGVGGKDVQAAGMMATLYYLGRLDGRAPGLDLENRVIDEVVAMRPADVKTTAARCGETMKGRGEALAAVGQHIQARAAKIVPNPVVPN